MFFEIYEKLGDGKYASAIHDAFEARCSSLLDGFTKVEKLYVEMLLKTYTFIL